MYNAVFLLRHFLAINVFIVAHQFISDETIRRDLNDPVSNRLRELVIV